MGRGANVDRSVLDLFLEQWPMLIFVPAVLSLVATLVAVTGWWDRRDRARLAAARPVRTPSAPTVVVPAPRRPATVTRTGWRRRTTCTCSWHGTGIAAGGPAGRPLVAVGRRVADSAPDL